MDIHPNLEIHSESCSHGKGVHPFPTVFTVRRLEIIIQEEMDAIVFLRLIREGDTASETDTTILGNYGATRQGKRRISYIASQQFTSDIPSGCDGIRKIRTSHRHNGIKSFMFCDLIARFLFFHCNLARTRTILIARNDMRIGNRKSTTNSKIRIQKKSTFYTSSTSRRCSESLILRYIIVAQRNTYAKIQPQKRRLIVYGKDFILREMSDTIILK